MRDKNVAGMLAIFLGMFGAHRFYLGQKGLGIFYLIFGFISWSSGSWIILILMAIDALSLFSMGEKEFDDKYNRKERRRRGEYQQPRRSRRRRNEQKRTRHYQQPRRNTQPATPRKRTTRRKQKPAFSPFKETGFKKYKDFDYEGAIEDFEKAAKVMTNDAAIYFNLACAYSLTENAKKAFENLDKAVSLGFDDFDKIKTHDAFAYIRVQPQFEEFEKNDFQLIKKISQAKEDLLSEQGDILQQLNRLAQLKEKGLLTDDEFDMQKEKILRK